MVTVSIGRLFYPNQNVKQVNAGPLEYASVFVAGGRAQNHPQEAVARLRAIYV